MKQLFYKIIYYPTINKVLRNINKALKPLLPGKIELPPSGSITIRNDGGKKLLMETNQTNYLTHLVFWNGYKNFEYTDIFVELIKRINVFYDIGANIGYYSLLAAMENEQIEVVGFEPASGPLFYFRKNAQINDFKNITIEPIALSHTEGEITFYEIKNKKYTYLEHNLAGEGNAGSLTSGRNFVPVNTRTTTLDKYIQKNNQQTIDLIKIDTEGTEHLILQQANHVLTSMKPIIICETLFDNIESELEAILKSHGYEFYNHHSSIGLKKVDSIIRKEDDGVRNCFFVHPSKFHLIEDFVV
jgi:FkbM family methyltransferase